MKILFVFFLMIFLFGCEELMKPSVEKTTQEDGQKLVNSLQYFKASNGLCFGVTTTSRMNTGGNIAYNAYLVSVDCAAVKL